MVDISTDSNSNYNNDEVIVKLTDWKKEPSVADLKQDFSDAESSRTTQIAKVNTWLDNLNITGAAKLPKVKNKSSVVPKLIRKQAEWRYSSLSDPFLSTEDIYNTDPVTYEDKEAAYQNGLVLNNQFNTKIEKVKFVDEYVRTAVDEGTVIVKLGWEFQEEERNVTVPIMGTLPVTDPALAQTLSAQGKPPVVETVIGYKEEVQTFTVKNHPTVNICDYRNVTIDPSCEGDLDKAKFIIYSFQTSLAELRADGRYKNLDDIKVTGSSPLSDPDHGTKDTSDFNFKDKPRKLFIAYEYWGFRDIDDSGKLTPIVATYVGDTLIRLERNPFPDKKLPFVIVQYLPVRKSIYGEPDGELLEDNQRIVGAVTRGMIDVMARSANGQTGYRKDALDLTNKRKYENGLDYEFNAQVDPRQAFHMHTFPEIPQSAVTMLNIQHAEAESLTGVKAFNNGITGNALGDTVGGQRNALDATAKRELGILRRLAEGFKQIGRKIVSMNAEFLDEEEVVRITNEQFVTIRRDDLAGNFDLKLSISTAEEDNAKASDLAFMLQTMGNNMDPALSQIILADVATLRKMPTLAKQIKDYKPTPNPLAEKEAALRVALLEAQVQNERAKAIENETDVGLKRAKTAETQAKVRNLHSDSDQKDLNYLEQESGLTRKHESDMKDKDFVSELELKAADKLLASNEGKGGKYTPIPAI